MRVISIDPGYDRLGIAVMDNATGGDTLLYSGCIESSKTDDLPERLFVVGRAFDRLVAEYQPDTMAIETLFFNKNIKTAMGVAQARGLLLYIAKAANCRIYEFSPQQIKIAVTGYGNSDKQAVINMVTRLVPTAPKSALDDEYDAIAVGITCLASYGRSR